MIEFFRKLVYELEADTLTSSQRQHLGEFFMSYKSRQGECNPSKDDMVKYLTLGWYLYTQVDK
jgi:hypothetical protein